MRPNLSDLAEQLERAAGGELRRELSRVLVRAALVGEAEAKIGATTRLRVRTGRLRGSIRGTVEVTDEGVDVALRAGGRAKSGAVLRSGSGLVSRGKSLPYARIQELGGTVLPVRSRYLAIPLEPARTAAGVSRYPSARWDPTPMHVRRTRDGRLFLFPNDGGPPRYALRDRVRIEGVGYLAAGAEAATRALPEPVREAFQVVTTPTRGGV